MLSLKKKIEARIRLRVFLVAKYGKRWYKRPQFLRLINKRTK